MVKGFEYTVSLFRIIKAIIDTEGCGALCCAGQEETTCVVHRILHEGEAKTIIAHWKLTGATLTSPEIITPHVPAVHFNY